ncbi:MAG: hypothetical protein COU06_01550 [Candidatus Harrisonbacteria bacterium CG10_big_fil_rev_8_21_14_0_10_38_8]|uniref:Prokaryotic-type class I peptide chain release factors domain-containing protein n=1 Tax=Candidatus Harrisonbacteria bacterium CG10_big_fil_rev_8_21_14_0_10_38_8 TaxID=1974582 RepID=A0A2M6WK34_9BACT|nr:MAG: hypothetical protein COU06_01550 [Candidatus Harrisonbacteria bacterium CG10_big_fil_rev_8_21_14_0_10_38_8]
MEKGKSIEEIFKPLTGKYDQGPAYIVIYPGVGGDDAKDWANMLLDMYIKYCTKRGWKVTLTDDRGILVKGEYAYGYLKREMGVHRLVRLSPFNAKKLRHTSFALVEVTPVIPVTDFKHMIIPEADLKVEFSRSSGPGGQNVNKRETAVRVVHLPTGVAVSSQSERSQAQNKEKALHLLKSKLVHLMELHDKKEFNELKAHVKPEWGSQIRSYVLHPYKKVKDHRTGLMSSNPEDVLDGDLDRFIETDLEL